MNLYKKYLRGPAPRRSMDPKQQITIAEQVLDDEGYSQEEKINSLVIMVYKCIEIEDYSKAISLKYLVDSFCDSSLGKISGSLAFKGIRDDPGQQYISLLTSLRHISVLQDDYSFRDAKLLREFMLSDRILAPSYSLNIGRSILPYFYFLFTKNERGECLKIVEEVYQYFVSIVNRNGNGNLPSSSHFGDMKSLADCLQIMLSGREWILGKRERKNLFNARRIAKVCSRVSSEDFLLKYEFFLEGS